MHCTVMVLVESTPAAPITPTLPKFRLVAETIVQESVIVIWTLKVVVVVAAQQAVEIAATSITETSAKKIRLEGIFVPQATRYLRIKPALGLKVGPQSHQRIKYGYSYLELPFSDPEMLAVPRMGIDALQREKLGSPLWTCAPAIMMTETK